MKINDAATMDRILADDFVLSTGSGQEIYQAGLGFRSAQRHGSNTNIRKTRSRPFEYGTTLQF